MESELPRTGRAGGEYHAAVSAKSLAVIDHAVDGEELLIAYEMNNQPLPMLNGFPCRLIVPGWYGTYWVKALTQIEVLDKKIRWLLDGQGVQDRADAQLR